MSEVTGVAVTNIIKPGQFKIGSIGKRMKGIDVKLDMTASPEEGQGEVRISSQITIVINTYSMCITKEGKCNIFFLIDMLSWSLCYDGLLWQRSEDSRVH